MHPIFNSPAYGGESVPLHETSFPSIFERQSVCKRPPDSTKRKAKATTTRDNHPTAAKRTPEHPSANHGTKQRLSNGCDISCKVIVGMWRSILDPLHICEAKPCIAVGCSFPPALGRHTAGPNVSALSNSTNAPQQRPRFYCFSQTYTRST